MIVFSVFVTNLITIAAASSASQRILAHDCRSPASITAVASPDNEPDACMGHAEATIQQREANFILLARETVEKLAGFRCSIKDSREVSYCGMFDHQTLYSRYNYHNIPRAISVRECEKMIAGQYTDPRGSVHPIGLNEVTAIHYQSVGETKSTDEGTNIECLGGKFREGTQTYANMIVDHNLLVTVEKHEITFSDGELRASDGLHLPCSVDERGCETPEATFVWERSKYKCELATSRSVQGMIVQDKGSGDRVFMSTDGSLTRLIMKSKIAMCKQVVVTTNYDNLFLYEIGSDMHNPFSRQLNPESVSITTYVNHRDDFLYNHIIDQISSEMGSVLTDNCRRNEASRRADFFLKHEHPGLANFHVGGDTFATSAGEVIYYYRCQPLEAIPVSLATCYDSLPVRFDAKAIKESTLDLSGIFFVEPLTHRLSTVAVEIPCSEEFPPKYQLIDHTWIKASPGIHTAPEPDSPPDFLAKKVEFDRSIDWSKGGPYLQEAMRAMEKIMEMPKRREALGAKLSTQAGYDYRQSQNRPLTATDLFPQSPTTWFSGAIHKFLRFLELWGEGAAIGTSLYIIWRFFAVIIELLWGGRHVHRAEGFGWNIMHFLCCPAAYLAGKVTANYYQRPPGANGGSTTVPSAPSSPKRSIFKKKKNTEPAGHETVTPADTIELSALRRRLEEKEAELAAREQELATSQTAFLASTQKAAAPTTPRGIIRHQAQTQF